jgi:receptor protein-tyrosine kinase
VELRDYLKIIRARMGLGIIGVVVVLALAMAWSFTQKPTYHSQSQVIVLEQQNSGAILLGSAQDQVPIQPDQAFVLTQAEVVQSTGIAAKVIDSLRLNTTPALLLHRVTASTDGQSNVVTIDVTDASPAAAARVADAFATAYLNWSRDNQVASIKAAADQIQQRLTDAQAQVNALAKQKNPQSAATQAALQAAETLRTSLSSKLEQLRINQQLATGSASILASAAVESTPISPSHTRDASLGLAVGLLAGLGLMFLAEQLDTKIRTGEELEQIYGAPVIGTIPTEKFGKNEVSRLTLVQKPGSSAAEAYRSLRIGLDFINFERDIKTLLVTSAVPSEGKSTLAANLAVALAQAGNTVVLLSCDFHRPATSTFFDLKGTVGLSDVLTGSHGIGDALQKPEGVERLSVVVAGPVPPNPSELLGSSRMEAIVGALRESADWIILDAPPVLAVADAAAVARLADGVLLVTRVGTTKREEATAARDRLANIGARILGLAVWGTTHSSASSRAYSAYTSH